MSGKRSGLGRNLSALLSRPEGSPLDAAKSPDDPIHLTLDIEKLQPGKYQPRKDMDDDALAQLADSIKKQGLLQPLVVRKISPEQYEIIAGERRFRACRLNGMQQVPVVLRQVDDETAMAMALIENMQREALNIMDEARAMFRLTHEFSLTHQDIADLLCKSRTTVSNLLRLLNLDPMVMQLLEVGDIDMGHARCLLALEKEQQLLAAKWVVAKELSVRETESLVAKMKAGPIEKTPSESPPLFLEQLEILSRHWQKKVRIKPGKSGKGMLIIHYDDTKDLEKMIDGLIETVA